MKKVGSVNSSEGSAEGVGGREGLKEAERRERGRSGRGGGELFHVGHAAAHGVGELGAGGGVRGEVDGGCVGGGGAALRCAAIEQDLCGCEEAGSLSALA